MPDEAREVIFPQGVPVFSLQSAPAPVPSSNEPPMPEKDTPSDPLSTQSEGGLRSEDAQIQEQARQSRSPEEGADLLDPDE